MEFEICLEGLRFMSRHGVMPQERVVGNEFVVDVSLRIPCLAGVEEDNLDATVSYADVFDIVKQEMETPRMLLERVASLIRTRIMEKWPFIKGGVITICKSTPPITGITGKAKVSLIF